MAKTKPAAGKTAARRTGVLNAARRKHFLAVLAETANITHAARQAGVERSSLYRLRTQSESFRAAWDEAMNQALDDLEAVLLERAAHGVEKPIFYGGKACGSVRQYSDTLAMFILRANLALIDGELIQFGRVEALGERRFRLSHLLRGRRGTEWAMADHPPGGRFVVVDPALTGSCDLPVSQIGSSILFQAVGPGQDPGDAGQLTLLVRGAALRPPSPVHVAAERQASGVIEVRWIRRSRQGWNWIDGVDAPLGEEREAYRLKLRPEGGAERVVDVDASQFFYSISDQSADGGHSSALRVAVAQLSTMAGEGDYAVADFDLED